MVLRRSLAVCLAAVLCGGCASTQASARPDETLRAYSRALAAGRTEDAYRLLSTDAKKSISYEDFRRIVQENPEEVRDLAQALERPAGAPSVTATVTPPGGPPLLLVYEDGAWKIDGSSIDLYGQTTPERAVAAFVRAYMNRRFDVLLRFVPEAQRGDLDAASLEKAWMGEQREDVERMMQALKAALPTARFEILGERATMAYGASGTLELVREHGVWKIEDLK
ncbi:MAG: hypothetical protein DIU78_017435 [Pseudomonadota bacterium]|nr:MAG: hypothetical protein DIU78_18590 [Pseudomonadota bacterium]